MGGIFGFWGGWGCHTPQENSLKSPQDLDLKGHTDRQTDRQTDRRHSTLYYR